MLDFRPLLKEKSEIHDGSRNNGYRRGLFWTWNGDSRALFWPSDRANTYTQSLQCSEGSHSLKRFSCLLGDSQSDITTRAVSQCRMHLNGGLDNWWSCN